MRVWLRVIAALEEGGAVRVPATRLEDDQMVALWRMACTCARTRASTRANCDGGPVYAVLWVGTEPRGDNSRSMRRVAMC